MNFAIKKIPIHIQPIFLLMVALLAWLNAMTFVGTLVWMVVIVVSIIVHEFGHALTALYFRQTVRIDLVGLGGLTTRNGPPLKLWQNFLITMNGPLFGFLLAFIAYHLFALVPEKSLILKEILMVTIFVNIFWTIINLLPIQPLDGGHLVMIIFEGLFGFKGVKFATILSMVLAAGLSLLCFSYGIFIGGGILFLFAYEGWRSFTALRAVSHEDRIESLQGLYKQAEANIELGRLPVAEQELTTLLNQTKEGVVRTHASQLLANVYVAEGRKREAYNLLLAERKSLTPEYIRLLHQTACDLKEWHVATDVGIEAYNHYPSYQIALLNAQANAALGKNEQAMGWLHRAEQDGAPNIDEFIKLPEFEGIEK